MEREESEMFDMDNENLDEDRYNSNVSVWKDEMSGKTEKK